LFQPNRSVSKVKNQVITSELTITDKEAQFKIPYLLIFYHRIPILMQMPVATRSKA